MKGQVVQTSLQKQLAQHRDPNTSRVRSGQHEKFKDSFLFDGREAAQQDIHTIYSLGYEGFQALLELNTKFGKFETPLFSLAAKDIDRVLLNQNDNDKLSKTIDQFLKLLSQYFLLAPAGKALEWLIRRFRVNQFNVDVLIGCALPYYGSDPFNKLLTIIDLKPTDHWSPLIAVRKSKLGLSQDQLVTWFKRDRKFMNFILQLVTEGAKNTPKFSILFTFFTSLLLNYLQSVAEVEADALLNILPVVLKGLSSNCSDYSSSCYMVCVMLFTKCTFKTSMLITIVAAITEGKLDINLVLVAFVKLTEYQPNLFDSEFDTSSLLVWLDSKSDSILQSLKVFASEYKVNSLVSFLALSLFNVIVTGVDHSTKLSLLINLIQDPSLCNDDTLATLTESLLSIVATKSYSSPEPVATIYTALEARYEQFGKMVAKHIAEAANNKGRKQAHDNLIAFNKAHHGTSKHLFLSETNTSLHLSLISPDVNSNLIALDTLAEVLQQSSDKPFPNLEEVLFNLLSKSNSDINTKILDLLFNNQQLLDDAFLRKLWDLTQTMHGSDYDAFIALLMQPKFINSNFNLTLPVALQAVVNYFTNREVKSVSDMLNKGTDFQSHIFLSGILLGAEAKANDNKYVEKLVTRLTENTSNYKYLKALTNLINVKCSDLVLNFATLIVLESALVLSTTKPGLNFILKHNIVHKLKLMLLSLAAKGATYSGDSLNTDILTMSNFYLFNSGNSADSAFLNTFTIKFSLHRVIASLTKSGQIGAWLVNSNDTQESIQRGLTRLVFEVAACGYLNYYLDVLKLLKSVVLGSNVNAFCCHLYFHPDVSLTIKTRALTLLVCQISEPASSNYTLIDLQLTLPTLLVALSDSSSVIRSTALIGLKELLLASQTIKELALAESSVMNATPYFGLLNEPHKLPPLPKNSLVVFLEYLQTQASTLFVHPESVADVLNQGILFEASMDTSSKKGSSFGTSFLHFVLTLFQITTDVTLQLHFLKLIDSFSAKAKLKALLPTIVELMRQFNDGEVGNGKESTLPALLAIFTPEVMNEVGEKEKYTNALVYGLGITKKVTDKFTVSHLVLQRITPQLYQALNQQRQAAIFNALVLLLGSQHPELPYLAKRVLFTLPFATDTVVGVIKELVNQISTDQHPAKKKKEEKVTQVDTSTSINQLTAVLEAVDSKDDLQPYLRLVTPLFQILTQLAESTSTINSSELSEGSLNYLYQLIMSLLTNLFNLATEKGLDLKASNCRIDVVVQLLRKDTTPQTHHHTLLLVAAIASVYPAKILNYVMPIFTFMGTNVMQKDDPYTFHILGQTLQKIIPPLLDSFRDDVQVQDASESSTQNYQLVLRAKPVIDVFVNAILYIPPHRRLKLFVMLVDTLGTELLFGVLATILEKSVLLSHLNQNEDAKKLSNFAIDVASQFKPTVQVLALAELLTSVLDLPNCAVVPTGGKSDKKQPVLTNLFNLEGKTDKQVRNYKFSTVRLTHKLMVAEPFLDQLTELEPESDSSNYLDEQLVRVSQQLLLLNQDLKSYLLDQQSQFDPNTIHFFKSWVGFGYEVLNTSLALMTFAAFTDFLEKLLTHDSATVRYRSMGLLDKRLERAHTELNVQDINQFLSLTPLLTNIIVNSDEAPLNKQTAFNCLGLFLRVFSPSYKFDEYTEFIDSVVPLLLGEFGLKCANDKIYSSACLVLSYLCRELDTVMVEKVPQFLPLFLERVQTTTKLEDVSIATTVWLAQFVLLESVLAKLADFTTPYLPQIVDILVTFKVELRPKLENELTLVSKVDATLQLLNFSVEPRSLLPVLFQAFENAVKINPETTVALLELLTSVILSLTSTNTDKLYLLIFKFYVDAFNYRHRFANLPNEVIETVERSLLEGFVQLIMKLRDDSFKPIFLKLGEWATVDLEIKSHATARLTTFYHLIYQLLTSLKHVFAPYYVYTVDHATSTLAKPTSETTPDLIRYLLLTTTLSLQYDTEGLWTTDRFFQNLPALVHQIENVSDIQWADTYLVPTLDQLSQTVTHDEARKKLNLTLAQLTRSERPQTKIVALKCIQALYLRHQKALLPYLPETIPFLAEVLEDDDKSVLDACRDLLLVIEKYNGEPLDQYFR